MIQRWLDKMVASYMPTEFNRRYVPKVRSHLLLQRKPNVDGNAGQKQLLVDVSVICRNDARTGIQRVVRAVVRHLLVGPVSGYRMRMIAATPKNGYQYVDWNGTEPVSNLGARVNPQSGDIFLGLDLSAHIIPAHRHQMVEWKKKGVSFHFVIYDLLPLLHPEWFSIKRTRTFRWWLKAVAILADSAVCISHTVEQDFTSWLNRYYGLLPGSVPTCAIPMGWDIVNSKPSKGLPSNFSHLLSALAQGKSALMVGTLEPRKGHKQILDAFEQLWQAGKNYNLVIVGRPGWKTETIQAQLNKHHLRNRRLFWLEDASDEALLKLYEACTGVIIASKAEGFGLPLIEALGHGKPVLASDLPVFRFHSNYDIEYFSLKNIINLPGVIDGWLNRLGNEFIPVRSQQKANHSTWGDTATALINWLEMTFI